MKGVDTPDTQGAQPQIPPILITLWWIGQTGQEEAVGLDAWFDSR